jgi:predicted metal-dependent hydrolase
MDFEYSIRRSDKRSKLTITVERDRSVIVHAPMATSVETIEEIVQSKRQWIFEKIRHKQKYRDEHPPGKEMVSGESTTYLGRSYRLEFVESDADSVEFKQRFRVFVRENSNRRDVLKAWFVDRAKNKILPRVKQHAIDLGVQYREAKIVNLRFRWGSCTPANNINLNWRLIKAPMVAIDYVIVHELAHLIEQNHTPRFWNIVQTQIAKADFARIWLRDHGQLLEDAI